MRTGLTVGMLVGSIVTFGADSDAGEHGMDFARSPRISMAQRATEAVKMRRSRGYVSVLTVVRLAEISRAVHDRRRETMIDDAVEHVRRRWEGAVSWTYRRTALQVALAETRRRIRALEGRIDEVDAEVQRLRTEIIDIERRLRLRTRRKYTSRPVKSENDIMKKNTTAYDGDAVSIEHRHQGIRRTAIGLMIIAIGGLTAYNATGTQRSAASLRSHGLQPADGAEGKRDVETRRSGRSVMTIQRVGEIRRAVRSQRREVDHAHAVVGNRETWRDDVGRRHAQTIIVGALVRARGQEQALERELNQSAQTLQVAQRAQVSAHRAEERARRGGCGWTRVSQGVGAVGGAKLGVAAGAAMACPFCGVVLGLFGAFAGSASVGAAGNLASGEEDDCLGFMAMLDIPLDNPAQRDPRGAVS